MMRPAMLAFLVLGGILFIFGGLYCIVYALRMKRHLSERWIGYLLGSIGISVGLLVVVSILSIAYHG